MGMFKQMKDMKNMVEQAPDMINQANQLGAQAQEMGAAQQAAAMQAQQQAMAANAAASAAGATTDGGDFSPISNVTLEQYASICKSLGAGAADPNQAHAAAAAAGIDAADWDTAAAGWGQRMQGGTAVGQRFNALYQAG
jgi:hypothetical protein